MRKFIFAKFSKKRSASASTSHRLPPTPTAWPLRPDGPAPAICDQLQSPLYGKLSAELRLLIYGLALGDPTRLLHICKNTWRRHRRVPVAHYRCTDTDSPFPTWQHTCFDVICNRRRAATPTEDKLLALLLTCRLVYHDALNILYEENIFHFQGAPAVKQLRTSLSSVQWRALRHVHISTEFVPLSAHPAHDINQTPLWPDERLDGWIGYCQCLREIPDLRTLRFEITMRAKDYMWVLKRVLEALQHLQARVFEVELNVDIPDDLLHELGTLRFQTIGKERPENEEVVLRAMTSFLQI
ncbi:hypothetical protein BDV95DRAFT_137646 [Massariosphaeria phaeospora]|uniref:DUF7730 domain-containing protein n=1 Tax=Massariosphaeria phaeospora TaxID=100035 RepID=A0A7C8MFB0_9PLEO|nr:hypothetical protein BDV95DRAFT_137646 [Massariosphaeria phaeospora]